MFKQLLFKLAKAPCMGKLVGTAFRYFSWVIPVRKVYNSKAVLAFYHPKPCYENHMIISLKRAVANLQQMAPEDFTNTWAAVTDICVSHPEYQNSFVLVANGGRRQEVSQVHFHMFTNHDVVNGDWEIHTEIPAVSSGQITKEYFKDILQSVDLLNKEFSIVKKGYSLVYQYEKKTGDTDIPIFHIIAGKKGERIK